VIVVKLTGKVFEDSDLIRGYVEVFRELSNQYRIVVVTGGGRIAREYIELARKTGVSSNYWLDMIGIMVSRVNSYLLISNLYPLAYHKPIESLDELQSAVKTSRIIVLGGLIPGQSTASVVVESAEALGVEDVIYLSAIDHVYDKDPVKYSDARMYTEIKASTLIELLKQEILPGEYALIDIRALELAIRSKIKIYLAHYKDPRNITRIINGENPGTIIYPD